LPFSGSRDITTLKTPALLTTQRLMLQWWANFLDENQEKTISPFDYAKINNPIQG
jgi:hypothetical protein